VTLFFQTVAGPHENDGGQSVGAVFIGNQGGFAQGVPQQDFHEDQQGHQGQHDGRDTGHPVTERFYKAYDSVHCVFNPVHIAHAIMLTGEPPEMVDCGSGQGRRVGATTGVAALRRGLRQRENAGLGRKVLFLEDHFICR
jgi:hypothetical protein